MTNKKIFMSVTASAFIASAFIGVQDAEAASYKVKSGDSLWGIAQKHNTSVANLKDWNDLSSNLIFPNQILETSSNSNSNSTNQSTNNNGKSTYKVKSGDTLSGIASKHNISLSQLMKWNNLDSWMIYPGDVFVVTKNGGGESNNDSSSDSNTSTSEPATGSATVYTVKSGDTLSEIGAQYGVSVRELKRWNELSSSLIYVGQKLNIGSSAAGSDAGEGAGSDSDSSSNSGSNSSGSAVDTDYNVNELISTAKSLTGVGYAWGGSSPSGFDCSGFIHYVYNQAGKDISRMSSASYFNRAFYVNNPQVGDLVFFENTYTSGISHMGVYLGNNEFIHASADGVEITNLDNPYWSKHFDSFKRFY
ncbi:C40 family peptidase [Virgibacillus ihumii]|uniref:C40 family peptidase n=1 Tax=Virgibacillus ihumii TaxID=2686091 RepID=UPI00157C18A9|nr:LysM peptidoglycan-binding domain-containing protein [Virgibacillus ihumii]